MANTDRSGIDERLRRLGEHTRAGLEAVNVEAAVIATLRTASSGHTALSMRRRRRPPLPFLVAGVVVLVPTIAWAVSSLIFDAGPVTVHQPPAPTSADVAPNRDIHLGRAIDQGAASDLPGYLHAPRRWSADPPTYWVDPSVPSQLSITYPSSRRLPEIGGSGWGVIIQTFDGNGAETIRKVISTGTDVTPLEIGGRAAVYLSGGDHTLFYLKADGAYEVAAGRAVGNSLIFEHGELTVRIEGSLSQDAMVQLATLLDSQ